jgi:hypothetical protein
VSIWWAWFVGEQEMKQCVQARLQIVPATWNHSVSSETEGTCGYSWATGWIGAAG